MAIQRITSGVLANSAIVAADISDGIVTADKLASDVSGQINDSTFNIALLGFKIAVVNGLVAFNLSDGWVDEFYDQNTVDTGSSANTIYTSASPGAPSYYIAGSKVSTTNTWVVATSTASLTAATIYPVYGGTKATLYAFGSGGSGSSLGNGGVPYPPGGTNVDVYGGSGAYTVGDYTASPTGTPLYYSVNQGVSSAPGGNSGQGGGYAGWFTSASASIPAAIMVAGAGGGAGASIRTVGVNPGGPGAAGGAGNVGGNGASGAGGGHPSYPCGAAYFNPTGVAGGGTPSAGGSGGTMSSKGGNGTSGSALQGGNGATADGSGPSPTMNFGLGGGGGGAGYYGGGGGAGMGGGGGGSSYISPTFTNTGSAGGSSPSGYPGPAGAVYWSSPTPATATYSTLPGGGAPVIPGIPGLPSTTGAAGTRYSSFGATANGAIAIYGVGAPVQTPTMTLQSTAKTANAVPTKGRIVVFAEIQSQVLNTNMIASISRDGGTTYSNAVLADSGYTVGSSGVKIYTANVDLQSQPSGTSMKWKITGAAMSQTVNIHGVALQWD